MTYEDQLEIIIYELIEARKRASGKWPARLRRSENENLLKMNDSEYAEILLKLQSDFEVIEIVDYPGQRRGYTEDGSEYIEAVLSGDYLIRTKAEFDDWVAEFLRHRRNAIEKISWNSFLHVYDVLEDINNSTQLTNKDRVVFRLLKNPVAHLELFAHDTITMRHKYMDRRDEALQYLKNQNVIHDFGHVADVGWETDVWVDINLIEFHHFFEKAHKLYLKRATFVDDKPKNQPKATKTTTATQSDDIAYKVEYEPFSRKVSVNGIRLSQPNYESDNEKFIAYIIEHPNQKLKLDDVKKELGFLDTWDINKTLEVLGFTKEYRQAFFSVGNGTVEFRNPLTKEQMQKFGKSLSLKK